LKVIKDNSFNQGLEERVGSELFDSFSPEQLAALKAAFGSRQWNNHPVDFRGTFKVWRWRYYYVFLMGRNRRSLSPRERRLSALLQATFLAIFLLLCSALGILVLYLIKSAMGIDIFPNFSFGVWGWFKGNFL